MSWSLESWLTFLRQSGALIGLPLLVAGVAIGAFGYRLAKLCVPVTYIVIGLYAGSWSATALDQPQQALVYGIPAAVGLAAGAYFLTHHAAVVLAGLLGAFVFGGTLTSLHLYGYAPWVAAALGLAIGCSLAAVNVRQVVIILTALQAAVLFDSGLAAVLMASGSLFSVVRELNAYSPLVLPFLLLVPTVMSAMYQMSEIRRSGIVLAMRPKQNTAGGAL